MPKARKIRREVLFADSLCVSTICEYCGYGQYVTKSLGNLGTKCEYPGDADSKCEYAEYSSFAEYAEYRPLTHGASERLCTHFS